MLLEFALLAVVQVTPHWRPLAEADRQIIARAVGDHLLDGESARYRWPAEDPDAVVYCGFVNAKNSYGAYIGFQPFMVTGAHENGSRGSGRFFVSEVMVSSPNDRDSDNPIIQRFCSEAGFDLNQLPPETPAPPASRRRH